MLVVVDLLFEQQQNHAHGDNVLGKIPHFALNMHRGEAHVEYGPSDEYRSPCEKACDRNACTSRGASVSMSEVDAAPEIDGEKNGIQFQGPVIGLPTLSKEQKHRQR